MTIDVKPEITTYFQDPDRIQSHYRSANLYADDAAVQIGNKIDGDVLGEYDQADSTVANYDIAGSGSDGDGIGFTLTTSNLLKVFGEINDKLDRLNIALNDRWIIISPQFRNVLWQFIAGKESQLGDRTGLNGHLGEYGGLRIHLSNACGWSGRLEMGTNPTDGDTVVINGVTFTFKDTLAATAGNVHICDSLAETTANFVAAINTPGTSITEAGSGGFTALSAANQALLKQIVATDGSTYITLKAEGRSFVVVSETLTASADLWTTTKQIQHILAGQGKPIDVVVQKYAKLQIQQRSGYVGKDFIIWTLYGLKTFDEGDAMLVDVQIRSDAY